MNFIYHTISAQVDRYITRTTEETSFYQPIRFLVLLDIIIMFNEISREQVLDIINKHFPHLADIVNNLLKDTTT